MSKSLFKQPLFYTTVLSLLALGLIIASYVFGWTTPTQNPPAGNITLQSVTPGGSTGYVQFNNSGTFGGDANLFWDNTNKRLGIGTTTPASPLTVVGAIRSTTGGFIFPDNTTQATAATAGVNYWTLSGTYLFPTSTSYNVGIGTTTPSEKLEVAGNIKLSPNVIIKLVGIGAKSWCKTTTSYTGNLGGISGANAICAAQCGPGYRFAGQNEGAPDTRTNNNPYISIDSTTPGIIYFNIYSGDLRTNCGAGYSWGGGSGTGSCNNWTDTTYTDGRYTQSGSCLPGSGGYGTCSASLPLTCVYP